MDSRTGGIKALVGVLAAGLVFGAAALVKDVGVYATRFGEHVPTPMIRQILSLFADEGTKVAERLSVTYAVPYAFAQRSTTRLAAGAGIGWVEANLDDAVRATPRSERLAEIEARIQTFTGASPFEVDELVKTTVCDTVDDLLAQHWDMTTIPDIDVGAIATSYIESSLLGGLSSHLAFVVDAVDGVDEIVVQDAMEAAAGDPRTPTTTRMRLQMLARCLVT